MESSMTNQLVANAAFKDLDNDYSFFNDQVRDEVAGILSEALKSCPDDSQVNLVDRAAVVYDNLEAMWAILRHTASLANQHHGFVVHRNHLPEAEG
jgi:hypothetical protein